MYFITSPLEQFEIFAVYLVNILPKVLDVQFLYVFSQWAISFSNAFLTIGIILGLIMFLIHVLLFDLTLLAFNWQRGYNYYLNAIKNIISDLVTHPIAKNYYFVFFTFVFITINILNVLGLIPYTFVLTSQFFFTFGLAFLFFITLNITGIILHGVSFLNLFYPSGTPIFILPLLTLIEFVSYIARVFSLAIRLFANITAGHILVKILSWLTWMILDLVIISGVSFIIISSLWVLEFFISILQAYVFLTLLCLYLNDVLQLH
jgi:ATP synthase subunit 6